MDADGDQLQASRTFHSKDMWRRIWICLLSSSSLSLYLHLFCICLYSLRSLRAVRLPWTQHSMARICGAEYSNMAEVFLLMIMNLYLANVTLKSALLTLRTKVYWLCWLFIKSAFWKSSKEQWSHLSGTFKHCVSNSC